ncbi:DUF2185 domain-containing protein [Tenacibaculum sp. A30]|uniref:DUF2185 domain-containing protein n=1 Tax=Tenacibaculum sp. A30 TaxID=3442644 RepID=UPI003EBBAD0E
MDTRGILITKKILDDKELPYWMYREKAELDIDSGWRIFSGTESEEYLNNPQNTVPVSYETVIKLDPDIEINLLAPYGTAFERNTKTKKWKIVEDWNI